MGISGDILQGAVKAVTAYTFEMCHYIKCLNASLELNISTLFICNMQCIKPSQTGGFSEQPPA